MEALGGEPWRVAEQGQWGQKQDGEAEGRSWGLCPRAQLSGQVPRHAPQVLVGSQSLLACWVHGGRLTPHSRACQTQLTSADPPRRVPPAFLSRRPFFPGLARLGPGTAFLRGSPQRAPNTPWVGRHGVGSQPLPPSCLDARIWGRKSPAGGEGVVTGSAAEAPPHLRRARDRCWGAIAGC